LLIEGNGTFEIGIAKKSVETGAEMKGAERTIDPKELMSAMGKGGEDVVLIDVRRKDDYSADPQMIASAAWKDPNLVTQWSDELPKDKKVIVYCVRGGSVSNAVLDHLLEKDVKACYIQGGIAAWREQGGPLVKKMDR
jgi:rhodanese-related sulfurtransferase